MAAPSTDRVAADPDHPDDPLAVVVARASIGEHPVDALTDEAPETIELFTDQPLDLKVAYRFREHDREKDQYRFRIAVSVGDHRPKPAEKVHGDIPGWPDDLNGAFGCRVRIHQPGLYPATYEVEAEHKVMERGDEETLKDDTWRVTGTLMVLVHSRPT